MANEVQRLTPAASPTLLEDGALELTFDGQTTASISYSDINTTATFASKIQTELEALSNIGSGNVAVTWSTDHARIEFQGTLANTNVAEITVSSNTLKRAADTVSVTTTTNGAAEIDDLTGTGGSFSDGNDTDTAAVQTISFSNDPNDGNWFFDGGLVTYPSAPSRSGWTTTGDYVDGFTITKDDFASGQSPVSVTGGTLRFYIPGTLQVVTVTLPDSPTEGTLNVTLDGASSSDFNYNDSSPASIGGWTGGGSAGNWTYTRDTAASDVSTNGAEGSTPLRKAFTITPSTETQGSGGGYTITIGQGSYTLSGQTVGLKAGRTIAISQGSYTLSGQAVSLKKGYTVAIASGSYSLSGQPVGLATQRTIAIAQGSYSLTGQAVAFAKGFTISIGTGSYALTGQDAGLKAARTIAIANGSYALTGQELGLARGFVITIQQGSYSVTGQSVGIAAQRKLPIGQGAYVLSGQAVGLAKGYTIAIAQGNYDLTGQSVGLIAGRYLAFGQGTYALSGQSVLLLYVTPSQSGYAIACYVTSTAPHICQVTTSRSHAAGLTASDPIDALLVSTKPQPIHVPRSDPR